MKQKLILLSLVMGLTIVSQSSLSLGMGKIRVYSALNETLRSSIDLITNADEELENLEVKLASSEDYQKVGLDKSFVPSNILVSFDPENPSQINVTSNGPVTEPIVSLLLDVNWSNGRILREFTVLLDPPTYETVNTNPTINTIDTSTGVLTEAIDNVVINEPVTETYEPTVPSSNTDSSQTITTYTNEEVAAYQRDNNTSNIGTVESTTSAQETTPVTEIYSSDSSEVYVESGDTLWRIANNNKVGDLSAHQMMMAIYNKNPDAFTANNINQLIKGSRLQIPTSSEASDIGFSEAMAQVQSHHQSWSPASQDFNTVQTENTVEDEYQAPVSTIDYGVQLSGSDSDSTEGGQSNAEAGSDASAQAIEEDLYNKDAENSELKERISELEDIVEQQQDVFEISDDSLANLENQLSQVGDEAIDETTGDLEGTVDDVVDGAVDDTLAAADDVWDAVKESGDDVTNAVDDMTDDLDLNIDGVDGVDISEATDTQSDDIGSDPSVDEVDELDTAADTTVSQQEVTTTPVKTPVKIREEPSFIDTAINWVMDNLMWVLIGLVGFVVLLFVPKMLKGGGVDDDEEDGTSFLDDIKNRNKANAEDEIDATDTKVNEPFSEVVEQDSFEDVDDAGDDVLADLDKSIEFDDANTDEADTLFNDIKDEVTDEASDLVDDGKDLFESKADDLNADDGFDLDGFLNDDVGDDGSITKDHSETLAEVDFDKPSEIVDEITDEAADVDLSFDEDLDIDLGDDAEDLSVQLDEAVETMTPEVTSEVNIEEDITDTIDSNSDGASGSDDFSFDDDDFDFDLDEELDDLGDDNDVNEATDADVDLESDDEFNDMLDITGEQTETFEMIEEDSNTDSASGQEVEQEIDLGLEDLMEDADAIDTKLDLAKAYIDMGDAEGAKNLLNEIYAEGTEEQIQQAKKLLDDM